MDMELSNSSGEVLHINSTKKSRPKIYSSSSDEDNEYSNYDLEENREDIINHFLHNKEMANENQTPLYKHILQSYEGSARESRKRCKECYKKISKEKGRDYATKKTTRVRTFCRQCKGQPALCLKCFNKLHNKR
ncbi:hypothetical protein M0802_003506 [Mischocyttarus mexicanus]|nr:hypothetical protein M0802_003506 [Mischocyttarus mexicanus]